MDLIRSFRKVRKGEINMGALKSFWKFLVFFGCWLWHTDEQIGNEC